MPNWTDNTIMVWNGRNAAGVLSNYKVTDHSREPLNVSRERVGNDKRTVNGTLRRSIIKSNRSWSMSWNNIPSLTSATGGIRTADGGMGGRDMEDFYDNNPGRFRMVIRNGAAISLSSIPVAATTWGAKYEDSNFYAADVMITEMSHEVLKRGAIIDLWSMSCTLEEV